MHGRGARRALVQMQPQMRINVYLISCRGKSWIDLKGVKEKDIGFRQDVYQSETGHFLLVATRR